MHGTVHQSTEGTVRLFLRLLFLGLGLQIPRPLFLPGSEIGALLGSTRQLVSFSWSNKREWVSFVMQIDVQVLHLRALVNLSW